MSCQGSGDKNIGINAGTIIFWKPGENHEFQKRKIRLVNKEEIVFKKFDKKALNSEKMDGMNLVFDEEMLSRRHAKLSLKDGSFLIQDLKSTNGTYHNDCKLEQNREYKLKSGDNIRFGHSFILMIDISESNESSQLSKFTEKN